MGPSSFGPPSDRLCLKFQLNGKRKFNFHQDNVHWKGILQNGNLVSLYKDGEKITESEIKDLLNKLYFHSIKGYPYCLKLAHQTCKVTNSDLSRLANLYGFKNEFGSRDSLNE